MALLQESLLNDRPTSGTVHSRLPRLDLAIDWMPWWEEFRTSWHDALAGPKPEGNEQVSGGDQLRVEWVEGKWSGNAFAAAAVCHVAAIWLMILPIWGFLPQSQNNLAPVQIETDWYVPSDLKPILLAAHTPKRTRASLALVQPAKQPPQKGADAFHPRQTILSVPVRATHPRQTLVRPDAPMQPPKVVEPMPNVVEWSAPELKKPTIEYSTSASKPQQRQQQRRALAAPEIANQEKNLGPLNISQPSEVQLAPPAPLPSMSVAAVAPHRTRQDSAAPEIAQANGNPNDVRRLVAISAVPAPPAPEAHVPQGNLAANISISPDGAKPGAPGGAEHGAPTSAAVTPSAGSASANALPAAISVSASSAKPANGGIGRPGSLAPNPSMRPMIPSGGAPAVRNGPAKVAALAPGAAPEKLLSGQMFSMHVSMPNMTSTRGSWVLNFAQLGEDPRPMFRPKGELTGPLPVHVVDPKYPPETMEEHIDGEVVLYAIIRKDGTVDSIELVRSLDPRLDKAAMDALAQWRFEPGARAGEPVDLEAVVHVPFEYKHLNY
ncbi:MAG TPA: energy transducer TonB [Candidatus Acidoferrum sp.]|nr:energy transducer TonB [Candidatus Acidoferrum sp.]